MPNHLLDGDAINQAIAENQLNLPAALLRCLLRQLAAALPTPLDTPDSAAADTQQTACAMFFAMQPQDVLEAASAVRAIIAHFAAIDMHLRAARPGLSDATVMRLRASANACDRAAAGHARRGKTQLQAASAREAPAEPPPQPEPLPRPEIYQFQPRDRFGKPIPLANWEQMTMAQRRATYAPRRDPEIEAAAIADEDAMIAEQQALEAKERAAAAAG
jgi:hypothetical protein